MADQLLHLAGMSGRPNVTLQVIPYGAGAPVGFQARCYHGPVAVTFSSDYYTSSDSGAYPGRL
jgi:Domain of unknown function (DUF5753)